MKTSELEPKNPGQENDYRSPTTKGIDEFQKAIDSEDMDAAENALKRAEAEMENESKARFGY